MIIISPNDNVIVLHPIGLILDNQSNLDYFRTISFTRPTVQFISETQQYLLQTLY